MNMTKHTNTDQNENSVFTDLKSHIDKARQVQEGWAVRPVKERVQTVRRIRQFIVDNSQQIAKTISRENGKVLVDSLAAEVLPAAMAVSYYCKRAEGFLKPEKIKAGSLVLSYKRSKLYRGPYGVVGIISPWNYPFSIPFSEVIMALLAGNAVILKTASNMPAVSDLLVKCIDSVGLPEGLFHYINLPGRVAGDAFLESGIDKLFFTGSVETGKYLMKKASETLTPLVLELGGNDAMIVCKDADLDRAAAGAIWAGFSSAGQSCGGVERLYVAEEVYSDFLSKLKAQIETITVETEDEYGLELGALTTAKQLEHIRNHVNEAVENGAVIAVQSKIPDHENGFYYPATVLTNVNHEMAVMKDETFGPVIGIMSFKSEADAVRLANDSYLGLTGSVWSKNRRKAIKIGRHIKAGVITINDHLMSHGVAETPWGGFKQSGIGRTHGKPGFDEMTQSQVMVDDLLSFTKRNLWWPPYSRRLFDGLNGLIQLQYAAEFRRRLRGIRDVLKIVGRIF